ncbi:DUF433 domain-containing protein [bacterium]|nr:MAG: DUF433 domain-containing protein [bacterium]
MIPEELRNVLSQNKEVMSGAICFTGTRIPVSILLDNLREGVSLSEFFDAYPDVTEDQVQALIDWEDRQVRQLLGLAYAH